MAAANRRRQDSHWLVQGLRGIGLVAAAALTLTVAALAVALVVAWLA